MKYAKIGKVTTESVHKHTGKHWDEWMDILEKFGARNKSYKDLVAFLKTKYKLSVWWRNGVAYGFELVIGRRIEGYSKSAGFSTLATKIMPADAKTLWKLLFSAEGLACWLNPISDFEGRVGQTFETSDGIYGQVRTMKRNVRLRMSWQETEWRKPSVLMVQIFPQPKTKKNKKRTGLVFQHTNLPDGRLRMQMAERWKSVLGELHSLLLQEE